MKRKNEKDHWDRKAPMGRVEQFKKERAKRNAARPKQRWVGGETCKDGGHWERSVS